MKESAFVTKRSLAWSRLEALLRKAARRGPRALNGDELFEAGRLYRLLTSDISYAQTRGYGAPLLSYLNRLMGAAYAQLYRGTAVTGRSRIVTFYVQTFPQEVRRSILPIGLCSALTVLWSLFAYAIVWHTPHAAYALLPAELVPDKIVKSIHDTNFGFGPQASAAMSSKIITNNVRVAIEAFAGGIVTLGAFTIFEIVFNALMLGALAALYAHAGFGPDLWATIAPHGVLELTAIQIAGGSGLLFTLAILAPGRLRRRTALRENGRRAATLITGVATMLLIAGIIEGFFTPLRFSGLVRASVGIASGLLLIAYFSLCGSAVRSSRAA